MDGTAQERDQSQLQAIGWDGAGPFLVRGRAGSGRTSVALARLGATLRQPTLVRRRVLFVTPFSAAAESAAARVNAMFASTPSDLSIRAFSDLCRDICRAREFPCERVSDDLRDGFLRDAIAAVKRRGRRPVLDRSRTFFAEEIAEVIKGRALGRRSEYLALEREGRWRPLDAAVRATVWDVYAEYQARLDAAGLCDADDLPLRALAAIETGDVPGYDDVIVDDVHGLSRAGLLVCRRLAAPSDRLALFQDDEQRHHRQGFALREAGIDLRRSFELTRQYRPPPPIRAFADAILESESGEAPPAPVSSSAAVIVEAPAFADQWTVAAREAHAAISGGVKPSDVVILTLHERNLVIARRALASVNAAPALMTVDQVRGLEFAVVIVVDVNDGSFPADGGGHDLTGAFRDRRRLYIAATRATRRLVIIHQAGARSPFLPPIACDAS